MLAHNVINTAESCPTLQSFQERSSCLEQDASISEDSGSFMQDLGKQASGFEEPFVSEGSSSGTVPPSPG